MRTCGCCCGRPRVDDRQLSDLLAGYEDFQEFDPRELHLLEALRTLRSSTTARGWRGAGRSGFFPPRFPGSTPQRYWQDRILELKEQLSLMDEAPLRV